MLEDEADAPLPDRTVERILAVEQHHAAGRPFQAGDDAQQGGLARAGRPEQRHQLAGMDRQADVVERRELAEALRDVPDFDVHRCPYPTAEAPAKRHSTIFFSTSVTSASSASSEATAKAATKLYSL